MRGENRGEREKGGRERERDRERVIQACLDRPKRDSAHDGEWTIEGTHRHVETEGERLKYSNERFGGGIACAFRECDRGVISVAFQLHFFKTPSLYRKTYNKHKRAHAQIAVPEVNRKLAFGRNQITSTTVQTSR